MTKDRVIGRDNDLPWPRIKEDMQFFKETTINHSVIMGKNTYLSIPKKFRPLTNRYNIVISNSMSLEIEEKEGIEIARSIPEALDKAREYRKNTFIIGGATIYEQMLPFVERMYISEIKGEHQGDTFFPNYNKSKWKKAYNTDFSKFELIVYDRK